MEKLSTEIEALITTVIYLDCRLKAVVNMLAEKGIILPSEDIETATHKIHASERDVKRHEILCRMKDNNFDLRQG